MSQTFKLYEGVCESAEKHADRNGKPWLLVRTYGNPKPVAWPWGSYKGLMFIRGAKVSVEAEEGDAWFFAHHRDAVIDAEKSEFDVMGLSNNEPGRTQFVADLILRRLRFADEVCSDDVYKDAIRAFPDADRRFIGQGFRLISEQGIIHRKGYKNSERRDVDHSRPVSVWHLAKKELTLASRPSLSPKGGFNQPSGGSLPLQGVE